MPNSTWRLLHLNFIHKVQTSHCLCCRDVGCSGAVVTHLRSHSSLYCILNTMTKSLTVIRTQGPLNPDLCSLPPVFSSRGAHQISIDDLLMPGVSTTPATISHWRWKEMNRQDAGVTRRPWPGGEERLDPLRCTQSWRIEVRLSCESDDLLDSYITRETQWDNKHSYAIMQNLLCSHHLCLTDKITINHFTFCSLSWRCCSLGYSCILLDIIPFPNKNLEILMQIIV